MIGSIAAVIVIEAIGLWERRGVDDPVGAISVHGVGGIFGVLCVGIFADGQYGGGWNLTTGSTISQAYAAGEPNTGVTGILYDASNGFQQLICQVIGAATIIVVIGGIAFAFFKIQNALTKGGIRLSEAKQLAQAPTSRWASSPYPDFDLAEEEPVTTSV